MAGYNDDKRALIQKIQRDLKDRYKTRFSVLKELFQNADDAQAAALTLDLRDGFSGARNPLLCGPGLLVCNDGAYTAENDRGIKHASATSKTTDTGSAGRFGIGQKAVFQLCDAFIGVPPDHPVAFPPFVINPYIDVETSRKAVESWDYVSDEEVTNLEAGVDREVFSVRPLLFWLPLRRYDLRPTPHAGFFDRDYGDEASKAELLSELEQPAQLAAMLAAARHLKRFDLRRNGACIVSIERSGGTMTLATDGDAPVEPSSEPKPFSGTATITTPSGVRTLCFSGSETMSAELLLGMIAADKRWPSEIDFDGVSHREKALPHGACVLTGEKTSEPELIIREGVFLPIGDGDASRTVIKLGTSGSRLNLFLHGYYFVDPGRREILGAADGVAGETSVPQRWNGALRDHVVLPALPRLFLQSVTDQVLSSADLADVVRRLQDGRWFIQRHTAICRRESLAQIWKEGEVSWGCVDPTAKLRPVPALLLREPRRLSALLPDLASLAKARGLTICAADEDGTPRALAHATPAWEASELAALIDGVPAAALRRSNGAKDLDALLAVARAQRAPDPEVGRALRAKLREALRIEGANRAEDGDMQAIMRHVPRGAVVFLPEAAVSPEILASLAAVEVDALVISARWQPAGAVSLLENRSSVAPLLKALEALAIADEDDRRATGAAVEIADVSGSGVSGLAGDAVLREIKLFPVTKRWGERRKDERKVLSIGEFSSAARAGTLFLNAGNTAQNLQPLLAALPDLSLLVVDGNRADLFKRALLSETWNGDLSPIVMVGFVNRAKDFSEDPRVRGTLLDRLGKLESDDAIRAARRLVAGVHEAGAAEAKLYSGVPVALARLVENIVRIRPRQGPSTFLADERALGDVGPQRRKLLGLTPMLGPDLGLMLRQWLADPTFEASPEEGEAVLSCELLAGKEFDDLLRALPIHAPEMGSPLMTGERSCLASERPLPRALAGLLKRIAPAGDVAARKRQERVLPLHDALTELRAATVAVGDPAAIREVILAALAEVDGTALPADLRDLLRGGRWLSAAGCPVAPQDVLVLPEPVGSAARAVLTDGAGTAPYLVRDLPDEVSEHPGFIRHRDALLPDKRASFARLAVLVGAMRPVGLPVAWDEGHRRDLASLTKVDLELPAWWLAAALLGEREAGAVDCLAALAPARSAEELGGALNALAEAAGWPAVAEAGRSLYRAAFKQGVPALEAADRRRLFSAVEVLTAAGTWKRGSEVALSGVGLAPSCVLDEGLAEVLTREEEENLGGISVTDIRSSSDLTSYDHDARSAEDLRWLLEQVRGRIEADLALTLLGVAGRFPAMRDAMARWQGTHGDAAQHLAAMDEASKIGCGPRHIETQNRERRFQLERIRGAEVPAIALSGARFDARKSDDASFVVGNLHKEGVWQAGHLVHTVQIQPSVLEGMRVQDTIEHLRGLVRAIAGSWTRPSDSLKSADNFPGMRGKPSQALLEDTQAALREDLPVILKQLKTKRRRALCNLIDVYTRASERRLSSNSMPAGEDRAAAERRLWEGLMGSEQAQAELLECVRESLRNFEYDPTRVAFEVYQNADDATLQRDAGEGPLAFRLSGRSDGFDAVHWGRPINDRGRDRALGEDKNYHRDLRNMLMLHASEKDGANTTGKYGIGFKSVHLLSHEVRIASDLLATKIAGGMLPFEWDGGPDIVTPLRMGQRAATLISVVYDAEKIDQGRRAVERFGECAPYLPLFARKIRRVEVDGEDHARDADRSVPGVVGPYVATVEGRHGFKALVLPLGEDFTLAMKLDRIGPEPFPDEAPRLWWTAPLDVRLAAGWMLNGPFKLSANRLALADGAEARAELFRRLGAELGRQLLALYRVAAADWDGFVGALGLDRDATLALFSARLWNLFRRDLGDETARALHGPGLGLGALAAAPVVPAGRNGACLIRVCEGDREVGVIAGALCDLEIQDAVAGWDNAATYFKRAVDDATARELEHLGLSSPKRITVEEILRRELETANWCVSPELAARLGTVFSLDAHKRTRFYIEEPQLLKLAVRAFFLDRAGVWRPVGDLTVPRPASAAERAENLRAAFASPECVLSDLYGAETLPFVLLARYRSGYNPNGTRLLGWARQATTAAAREAVLRFLVDEDANEDFLREFRASPPSWAPDGVADGALIKGWDEGAQDKLRAKLRNYKPSGPVLPDGAIPEAAFPLSDPRCACARDVLERIWRLWDENRFVEIPDYEHSIYPAGYTLSRLQQSGNKLDLDDREGWFTLLALACFQGSGRTRDGQHRTFIESAARGWWAELAQAPPDQNHDVWVERLREWAEDDDLRYWEWRRRLIDLYRIARWLPQYARAVTLLPRAVKAVRPAVPSLRDLFAPASSPVWREAGLEAASLSRTLGLGANWMVRELVRSGFWQGEDAEVIAPYGWASTGRVRSLMSRLDFDVADKADMDLSRDIWSFVSEHLPHRRVDLLRDGDLPLQIITLADHAIDLEYCFSDAAQEPQDGSANEDDTLGEAAE